MSKLPRYYDICFHDVYVTSIVFGYDLIAHSIAFVSRKLNMFVQEFEFLSRTLKF